MTAAMNGSEKSNNIALTEGQNLSVRKKYYIFLVHFLKLFLKQFSSELVQHITSYFLLASDRNEKLIWLLHGNQSKGRARLR